MLFLVRNELGAVQFTLLTGWYPDWKKDKYARTGVGTFPMPSDLGYHSPKPHYEGQTALTERCEWTNNGPCYYDGSTLNAEEPFDILLSQGESALWKYLEEYHKRIFKGAK